MLKSLMFETEQDLASPNKLYQGCIMHLQELIISTIIVILRLSDADIGGRITQAEFSVS